MSLKKKAICYRCVYLYALPNVCLAGLLERSMSLFRGDGSSSSIFIEKQLLKFSSKMLGIPSNTRTQL